MTTSPTKTRNNTFSFIALLITFTLFFVRLYKFNLSPGAINWITYIGLGLIVLCLTQANFRKKSNIANIIMIAGVLASLIIAIVV